MDENASFLLAEDELGLRESRARVPEGCRTRRGVLEGGYVVGRVPVVCGGTESEVEGRKKGTTSTWFASQLPQP